MQRQRPAPARLTLGLELFEFVVLVQHAVGGKRIGGLGSGCCAGGRRLGSARRRCSVARHRVWVGWVEGGGGSERCALHRQRGVASRSDARPAAGAARARWLERARAPPCRADARTSACLCSLLLRCSWLFSIPTASPLSLGDVEQHTAVLCPPAQVLRSSAHRCGCLTRAAVRPDRIVLPRRASTSSCTFGSGPPSPSSALE